jgi:hypothetical protein
MDAGNLPSPGQLLCIEQFPDRLYVEAIQVTADRLSGWVRPLALVKRIKGFVSGQFCDQGQTEFPCMIEELAAEHGPWAIIDLRSAADLILPLSLFREVWDTEFIPLFTHLELVKDNPPERQLQQTYLRSFINTLWSNFPTHFQAVKRSRPTQQLPP